MTAVMDDAVRELAADVRDLTDEVAAKNHVMVTVGRAETRRGRSIHRIVDEMRATPTATLGSLYLADKIRALRGAKPLYIPELLRRGGLELVAVTFNLRTNAGADFVYNNLSGTSVAVADTLAISNNTLATNATDTSATLPWSTAQAANAASSGTTGEWTGLGLVRKVATTNSHSAGATTYTLAATWTATNVSTGTSKAGLFGGAAKASQGSGATNILVLVNTFTATDLAISDQLTLTWTITI